MRSHGDTRIVRWAMGTLAALTISCAPVEPEAAAVSEAALGEPRDGFPTWEERVVHVWTNRARAAPADDLASCTQCAERACYTAQPPLAWTHDLARASRFHSEMLQRGGCSLQHDSPCTLVSGISASFTPGPCSGAPSCACTGGAATCGSVGTTIWDRLAAFGFAGGSRGENIAAGSSDPVSTFYQWLYERDTSATCGYRGTNGHRYSILNGAYSGLGVGKASGGNVWTQDFTSVGAPTGIVAGVHYPRTGASIELRANWYASAPTTAEVNVDGTCTAMSVERGTATNGTYLATVGLAAGCHRYVFRFGSSSGVITYPSTGAYGVGCTTDWDAAAPPSCGAGPTDAGPPDAGRDAAPTPVDAGRDAGPLPIDAGPPPVDAAPPPVDAASIPIDSGAASSDASDISSDAGDISSDAGDISSDASSSDAARIDGAAVGDASPVRDAAIAIDALADGGDPGPLRGECVCAAPGAPRSARSSLGLLAIAWALALRTRRLRRASGGGG